MDDGAGGVQTSVRPRQGAAEAPAGTPKRPSPGEPPVAKQEDNSSKRQNGKYTEIPCFSFKRFDDQKL